ncbi:PRD domain-containing protein [Clostridium sp. KNHs205]|uniref:BglG family transcription antiterminator LicT n=1 Tax=Clostridium sp. KNHs205 TaxID=1449050 RepID=UPI00051C0844|nr:PRD domain-containing protein [Clostridium sp. KNHs205]
MVVEKIINNNIISSFDEKGNEIVVMGRGLGFKVKPGQTIDQEKVEKIFRMDNDQEAKQLEAVLADIPIENIQLCNEIISYAKTVIKSKLSKNIYITLTDHINYAITRYQEGIHFTNALKWEIKKFYHEEFEAGKKAVELIRERIGIDMTEDEAASIALHFVNAELGIEISNTIDVTKLIQNVLKIITYHFQLVINEDTINYERFITHLKFFSQRVVTNNNNTGVDEELYQMVKNQYPAAYACAEKIKAYVEQEYHIELPKEEMVYLTIHIKRIVS